jgi:hypothetical protein
LAAPHTSFSLSSLVAAISQRCNRRTPLSIPTLSSIEGGDGVLSNDDCIFG